MTKRTNICDFGKFLRKLRIDNDDEKLKDIAKKAKFINRTYR